MSNLVACGCAAFLSLVAGPVLALERPSPAIDYATAPFTTERVLDWGSRPDWSPDGKRLAFTESDVRISHAYELDIETRTVRCLTCYLGMAGLVTRVYYLPDGSFLFLGPRNLGTANATRSQTTVSNVADEELYWAPASLGAPLRPLAAPAFGEIAIARATRGNGSVAIAWGDLTEGKSRLHVGALSLQTTEASLEERRTLYDSSVPHHPPSVTVSEAYGFAKDDRVVLFYTILADGNTLNGEMYEVDVASGKLASLYEDPAHNETHLFPGERFGLEETNRASDPAGFWRGVSSHGADTVAFVEGRFKLKLPPVEAPDDYAPNGDLKGFHRPFDLYVVDLSGKTQPRRLTGNSKFGANTHQSVPSPDGRRIAYAVDPRASRDMAKKGGLYIGSFNN